jgi:hypothetical protein
LRQRAAREKYAGQAGKVTNDPELTVVHPILRKVFSKRRSAQLTLAAEPASQYAGGIVVGLAY